MRNTKGQAGAASLPGKRREAALSQLGKVLFEAMERLDPGDGPSKWGLLSFREREFYRLAVRALLDRSDIVLLLIDANKNMIGRRAKIRK